jgi:hypothetical protein
MGTGLSRRNGRTGAIREILPRESTNPERIIAQKLNSISFFFTPPNPFSSS